MSFKDETIGGASEQQATSILKKRVSPPHYSGPAVHIRFGGPVESLREGYEAAIVLRSFDLHGNLMFAQPTPDSIRRMVLHAYINASHDKQEAINRSIRLHLETIAAVVPMVKPLLESLRRDFSHKTFQILDIWRQQPFNGDAELIAALLRRDPDVLIEYYRRIRQKPPAITWTAEELYPGAKLILPKNELSTTTEPDYSQRDRLALGGIPAAYVPPLHRSYPIPRSILPTPAINETHSLVSTPLLPPTNRENLWKFGPLHLAPPAANEVSVDSEMTRARTVTIIDPNHPVRRDLKVADIEKIDRIDVFLAIKVVQSAIARDDIPEVLATMGITDVKKQRAIFKNQLKEYSETRERIQEDPNLAKSFAERMYALVIDRGAKVLVSRDYEYGIDIMTMIRKLSAEQLEKILPNTIRIA